MVSVLAAASAVSPPRTNEHRVVQSRARRVTVEQARGIPDAASVAVEPRRVESDAQWSVRDELLGLQYPPNARQTT